MKEAGVGGVGQRAATGEAPGEDDDLNGPGQAGDGLRPQRVADGYVAVDGEGRDGQHAGVGRHLGDEGLDDAEARPEPPRVRFPDRGHLWRKSCTDHRYIKKVICFVLFWVQPTETCS